MQHPQRHDLSESPGQLVVLSSCLILFDVLQAEMYEKSGQLWSIDSDTYVKPKGKTLEPSPVKSHEVG